VPVGVVLEDEEVRKRNALHLAHDGAGRPQLVAHRLHGEGLLEELEEAVGLELVQVGTLGALGLIELDRLVHERPDLLRLLLGKLLFSFIHHHQ
jgi:hypothetical protein